MFNCYGFCDSFVFIPFAMTGGMMLVIGITFGILHGDLGGWTHGWIAGIGFVLMVKCIKEKTWF